MAISEFDKRRLIQAEEIVRAIENMAGIGIYPPTTPMDKEQHANRLVQVFCTLKEGTCPPG